MLPPQSAQIVIQTGDPVEVTIGDTAAEIELMPKTAFVPQPENLLPYDWQLQMDLNNGANNYGPVAR